jgi:hypothetical protein
LQAPNYNVKGKKKGKTAAEEPTRKKIPSSSKQAPQDADQEDEQEDNEEEEGADGAKQKRKRDAEELKAREKALKDVLISAAIIQALSLAEVSQKFPQLRIIANATYRFSVLCGFRPVAYHTNPGLRVPAFLIFSHGFHLRSRWQFVLGESQLQVLAVIGKSRKEGIMQPQIATAIGKPAGSVFACLKAMSQDLLVYVTRGILYFGFDIPLPPKLNVLLLAFAIFPSAESGLVKATPITISTAFTASPRPKRLRQRPCSPFKRQREAPWWQRP